MKRFEWMACFVILLGLIACRSSDSVMQPVPLPEEEIIRLLENAYGSQSPQQLEQLLLQWHQSLSSRDGNSETYVMDADGNHQRRLTGFSFGVISPSWSPDGRRILFALARFEL